MNEIPKPTDPDFFRRVVGAGLAPGMRRPEWMSEVDLWTALAELERRVDALEPRMGRGPRPDFRT